MGNGFWLAVGQMCQICFWTVRYLPAGSWRFLPRRVLAFGLAVPVFVLFQLLHWLGFALDEVLFRRYRRVKINRPVFVTGIPRSGTTHLQRVLAGHEQLTSMQMWECFLAPSITERYLFSSLSRLFSPLRKLSDHFRFPFFEKMRSVHKLGLNEAEEDFVALLPINACFLLVVLFPEVRHYWQLSDFDHSMSDKRKAAILRFYRRMIQKHLYFHGPQKRYLCKNPSFMSWIGSLNTEFEDASFLVCEREAAATVASQISSLRPIWRLIYGEDISADFSSKIVSMLAGYYHYLDSEALQEAHALHLPMSQLVSDLESTVKDVLKHCELPLTQAYASILSTESSASKTYRSSHSYDRKGVQGWSEMASDFPLRFVETAYKGEVTQ